MALDLQTVESYIGDARTLLLDQIPPFRYSDTSLLIALNLALLEGRRLRPDPAQGCGRRPRPAKLP